MCWNVYFIKYNLRLARLCPEKAAIQIEILWIFVFPPSCQIFHALCLPISYTEQYFKEKTRCPWILSLHSKETAYTSLSSFFCITIFFWPFNLSSALQRSPYISSFCHLTLFADRALFTFFSLSRSGPIRTAVYILPHLFLIFQPSSILSVSAL